MSSLAAGVAAVLIPLGVASVAHADTFPVKSAPAASVVHVASSAPSTPVKVADNDGDHDADDAGAPSAISAAIQKYTVKTGDTLSKISVKFYGIAQDYKQIASANGIPNPNLIFPNQVFTIPNLKSYIASVIKEAPPAPVVTKHYQVVTKKSVHYTSKVSASAPSSVSSGSPQAYARSLMSATDFGCFNFIIMHESGWRWNATNPSSGAYGIPQALPGSKMASAGADWRTNPDTQIRWAISYMKSRYGSICGAASFWRAHSWY